MGKVVCGKLSGCMNILFFRNEFYNCGQLLLIVVLIDNESL